MTTAPQQPHGTGGRDPRQPFGQPPPQPVSTAQFAQPHSRRPLWITLAALALVAAMVWFASRWPDQSSPAPAATPATSSSVATDESGCPTQAAAPSSPASSATAPHTSVPFTSSQDSSCGIYTIVSSAWTSQGLELVVRISLSQGQQRLGFFALDNTTTHDYDPAPGATDQLNGQQIAAGQTLTGSVVFAKPRGDTTVFLAGSDGRQVAALLVKG